MIKVSSLCLVTLSMGLGAMAVTPLAQAFTEQSQWQKVEQSVTAEVNGTGTAKVESTQKAEQFQSQQMNENWGGNGYRYNRGYVRYYAAPAATYGQAYLGWGMRGGTCHVRYTENSNRGYKYNTSAACDDGGMIIGGLRSGWTYRFQVRKDDGAWSRPVRIKAS